MLVGGGSGWGKLLSLGLLIALSSCGLGGLGGGAILWGPSFEYSFVG